MSEAIDKARMRHEALRGEIEQHSHLYYVKAEPVVSDMEFDGQPIDASKTYKVAGWASVAQPLEGTPVWDVVADYMRDRKTITVDTVNEPLLKNVGSNPGMFRP